MTYIRPHASFQSATKTKLSNLEQLVLRGAAGSANDL